IIAHGGKHGQHHHQPEAHRCGACNDLGNPGEIRHGSHEYHHEHIEHGPLPDEFEQLIQTCTLPLNAPASPALPQHEHHQCDELGNRHHHTGCKNDQGEIPRAEPPQFNDPAQYGVRTGAQGTADLHHGHYVGRDVGNECRNQQCPYACRHFRLALVHEAATAFTVFFDIGRDMLHVAAHLTTCEPFGRAIHMAC